MISGNNCLEAYSKELQELDNIEDEDEDERERKEVEIGIKYHKNLFNIKNNAENTVNNTVNNTIEN